MGINTINLEIIRENNKNGPPHLNLKSVLPTFALVKKCLAVILLIAYITSGAELRELMKLPVLIQHYQEHRQLDGGITFTQFLIDHYNNIPHTDNDEERDNQLPFKKVDSSIFSSPVVPASFAAELRKPVIPLALDEPYPKNDNLIPSANISNIWQPPRSGRNSIV